MVINERRTLYRCRSVRGIIGRSARVFLSLLLLALPIFGALNFLAEQSFAANFTDANYTYIGNIGNVTTTWANNGDLVNPTMVTYGVGGSGLVYVYCDSTAMPYATGGMISTQATPGNWRTIVIFHDNDDGTFSYQSMVTVQVAGSGISYSNNGKPLGFVADTSGNIYMTAPAGYLVARYASSSTTPTVAAPTLMGPMGSFWQQIVNGKPSFDLAGDYILVPGQFQAPNGVTYAVAHVNLGVGNPVTDTPTLVIPYPTNGDTYWMETIAANDNGVHFAGGSFQLGGSPFNIVRSDPVTNTVTPISPPNISGINDEQQAGIYNIYSISVDDSSNIYVSGNFGVTASGQYQEASLLKIDQNGNYITTIAPKTNTASTLGSITTTNAVTINRENQWVFVVDDNNTSGTAVKIFAFNGTLPGTGGGIQPCTPLGSFNVDTGTGTVVVNPPNDGSVVTISNQSQASYSQNEVPTTTLMILPGGILTNQSVNISTSIVSPTTGATITSSGVINMNGTTNMTVTTHDDSNSISDSGTPTTNPDGSKTTSVSLVMPDSTTFANTVNIAANASGGNTITSTKAIVDPQSNSYTTVTIISSDSSGNINISLALPAIVTGDSYVTVVSTNNGATACNLSSIPWTAGQTDPTITLSAVPCTPANPFNITIIPTIDGTLGTDCATITTTTNNPTGFKTTLVASSEDLTCTTGSGTYAIGPASDPNNTTALSGNQWGWYLGYGGPPSTFFAPPTTPYVIQSGDSSTSGNSSIFWIGAQLDLSQPPCTYTGEIVMTASVNPLPALSVTSVSPATGTTAGGDTITITGNNFGTASSPYISGISVGGVACSFFAVVNNTTATCVTPPNAAGTYDVSVAGFGETVALPNSFTYTGGS